MSETENLKNQTQNYEKYDTICWLTYTNLKSFSNNKSYIPLQKFSWKNKEHQFLWYSALNVMATTNKTIRLDRNLLYRLWLSIKFRKRAGQRKLYWIKKCHKEDVLTCDELLKFERPVVEQIMESTDFNFYDIVKEYYI